MAGFQLPQRPERLNFVAFTLVGLITVVGTWIAASGEVTLQDQLPALNIAFGGLILLIGASGIYLINFRRAIKARLLFTAATLADLQAAAE